MTTNRSDRPGRLYELDVLRGLAALGVVIFHYWVLFGQQEDILANRSGYLEWMPFRIQIFCIISGFVMTMISQKKIHPFDFILSRFSRLWPVYAVVVTLTTILYQIFPIYEAPISWKQYWINLTMLQSWFGVADIDGPYWFFRPELSFYALIVLLMIIRGMRYIEYLGIILLLIALLVVRYSQMWDLDVPKGLVISKIMCFWHLFFAGILFYKLKANGSTWQRHSALGLCFIFQLMINDDIYALLSLGLVFIIFYMLIGGYLSWIVRKPLVFLGTISYSLFLVHQLPGYIMIKQLNNFGVYGYVSFLIPMFVSIFVAVVLTYFVEIPVKRWMRDWCQKLN